MLGILGIIAVLVVLGVYRDSGDYIGAPKADARVYPGDLLILYGRSAALRELDQRRAGTNGEAAHHRAVSEQKRHMARQDVEEEKHGRRRGGADWTVS